MTILRNVRLVGAVDGASGEPVDVGFDEAITSIRPAAEPAPGTAKTLLPGLIDTHVHLGERSRLVDAARSGLTTVVDLGTHPDSLIERLRADDDLPTIVSAGSAASAPGSTQIEMMGFPAESGVAGPDDAERFLDWRVDGGADLIKIIIEDPEVTEVPALDVPTLTALVDGAHERGRLTIAHAVTAASYIRGLDAGVDVLTHTPFDRSLPEATLTRLRESGTVVSPTLVMMRAVVDGQLGEHADAAFKVAVDNVRAMLDSGITVIAGTDANETEFAPVHHGPSLHDELGHLADAGMTPAEAIRSASSAPADVLGLGDRGRLLEGARADLLLVDGDPLTDLSALRSPAEVWVAGNRLV